MNTKQRDIIFQRWRGVFQREARDLTALDQAGQRALADYDVRSDPTLPGMIRAELQERRAELEQKQKSQESQSKPVEPAPNWRSEIPERVATQTPQQDLAIFNRLALTLCAALESGDDIETAAVFGKMRAVQERSPEVIPVTAIGGYEQRVEKLRIRLQKIRDEIASLTQQAVAAAHGGSERQLARSIRRLAAIHAAHPRLLDEAGLESVRNAAAYAAAERHEHQRTTNKLLERERAIAAEIKTLAAAVRDFHQAACTIPIASEAFREAEAVYLGTIQRVCTYDSAWFSDVVLEMADLLAEWTTPPLGAEDHIDRFLDSVSRGLSRIRAEMQEIDEKQDTKGGEGGDGGASAVP